MGGLLSGPLTESTNGRTTDKIPDLINDYNSASPGGRVAEPIGPHGSSYIRLLRARYNTDIANPSRNFRDDGFNADHFNNFLLCFQCHERRAFDPYWAGADAFDTSMTNFFGNPVGPVDLSSTSSAPPLDSILSPGDAGCDDQDGSGGNCDDPGTTPWELNLHMYHLVRTGAYCHECHYNIHSNAQARNTIYGDGTDCIIGTDCAEGTGNNAGQPPDVEDGIGDGIIGTHLIWKSTSLLAVWIFF